MQNISFIYPHIYINTSNVSHVAHLIETKCLDYCRTDWQSKPIESWSYWVISFQFGCLIHRFVRSFGSLVEYIVAVSSFPSSFFFFYEFPFFWIVCVCVLCTTKIFGWKGKMNGRLVWGTKFKPKQIDRRPFLQGVRPSNHHSHFNCSILHFFLTPSSSFPLFLHLQFLSSTWQHLKNVH